MNRLHQLRETLPQNIADNAGYDNLEFVVLDYHSEDGLADWILENMSEYLESGKLIYYRTTEPQSWDPSHSKNIIFKLATGDILCCIWADYYTGKNFADYVEAAFTENPNIALTPIEFPKKQKIHRTPGDVLGKVCVKKSDFEKIRGFDERMDKHGYEDYDFVNRLEMIGVKRVLIDSPDYLRYIPHPHSERYTLPTEDLANIYLNYRTHYESGVILLYKDQCFERGTLIDNFSKNAGNCSYAYMSRDEHFEFSLDKTGWQTGRWVDSAESLTLLPTGTEKEVFVYSDQNGNWSLTETESQSVFYPVTDNEVIDELLTFKHFIYTRSIMEQNLCNQTAVVNEEFGRATVYKNFQSDPVFV